MNSKSSNPKKTIYEWWRDNKSLYSSIADAVESCSESLNVQKRSVIKAIRRMRLRGLDVSNNGNGKIRIRTKGLTEQELRKKHDPLYRLEQAVIELEPGKFIPEHEFRILVSLDNIKFRTNADLPKFDSYKGKVNGITYWGHPKDIKRLKEEGILS